MGGHPVKFSIRSIFAFTLVVAMGIQTSVHWSSLGQVRAEIQFYKTKLARQHFDSGHVNWITSICESAIDQYPDADGTFFPTSDVVESGADDK